jgi:exopolysaccharide biosynthesis polyprenyl glycosylphosphotransferase
VIGDRQFKRPAESSLSSGSQHILRDAQVASAPPVPQEASGGGFVPLESSLPPLTSETYPWTGPQPAILQDGRPSARRRWRRGTLGNILLLIDLAATFAMLELAEAARVILPFGRQLGNNPVLVLPSTILSILVIWLVVSHAYGVYDPHYHDSILNPRRVLWATLTSAVIFSGTLYFTNREMPRLLFVYFVIAQVAVLMVLRLALWPLVNQRAWYQRRVLIIGGGAVALEAARMVRRHADAGLRLIGCVSDTEAGDLVSEDDPEAAPLPLLGKLNAAPVIIREREIDDVIITLPWQEREQTEQLVRHLDRYPVQIRMIPDYLELSTRMTVENFGGLPLISLNEAAITGWQARMKRVVDIVASLLLLVLTCPLLLLIALAIRLDSPGPALFVQKRVGQYHRIFTMYKFRTMVVGADKMAQQVAQQKDGVIIHKRRRDPRITKVGAFLRKTSLDELPQLINVIKGDMSLVGPRPELPWLVVHYAPWQYRRFTVPQGITGWWQVNGRSDRPMHLHTEDDLFYIRNYSLWLDLKIMLMTVKVALTGKGAY